MKNAIILHGTSSNPNSFWYPGIKNFFENCGYDVWVPFLPKPDKPDLEIQIPFVLKGGKFNEETVIVAHSAGCPLTLALLETLDIKIKKIILVAGFVKPLNDLPSVKTILKKNYNWKKIQNSCSEIFIINSNDDPWGCNDKQGKLMFDNLGGTLIVKNGHGHMGSDDYNQPYKEFPLVEKLIEL